MSNLTIHNETTLQVDIVGQPLFEKGWNRFDLYDEKLKSLQSHWSDEKRVNFEGLTPGTYGVRVTTSADESMEKIAVLAGEQSVKINFAPEPQTPLIGDSESFFSPADSKSIGDHGSSGKIRSILDILVSGDDNQVASLDDHIFFRLRVYVRLGLRWFLKDHSKGVLNVSSQSEWTVDIDSDHNIHGLQVEAEVGTEFEPRFIVIPPGGVTVTLARESDSWMKNNIRISVSTNKKKADALGRLLVSGNVGGAKSLMRFAEAQTLMQNKMVDHAAAAIGGYYLLRFKQFEYLHDWTRNLAQWFPQMADGAIIHAWFILANEREQRADVVSGDFRRWLLEAMDRGIPLYTEGVNLLYEGLTQIWLHSGKKDHRVGSARKLVERTFIKLIPGQLYTTLDRFMPPADPIDKPLKRPNL